MVFLRNEIFYDHTNKSDDWWLVQQIAWTIMMPLVGFGVHRSQVAFEAHTPTSTQKEAAMGPALGQNPFLQTVRYQRKSAAAVMSVST